MRAINLKNLWTAGLEVARPRQKSIIGSVLVSLGFCCVVQFTGGAEALENRIGRPALFSLREALDRAPKLDPRIVIYAYNDDTVTEFGRPDLLPGKAWGQIIEAISFSKPKAILIDMIFGNPRKDKADVAAMNQAFKRKTPIYTSAAVLPNQLKQFKVFNLKGDAFDLGPEAEEFIDKYKGPNASKTVYGPADNLPELHKKVAQINFRAPGFFMPIVTFPPDKILKHLGIAGLEPNDFQIKGFDLYIRGSHVPLNEKGEAIANFSSRRHYFKNTYGISDLLENRRSGLKSSRIGPDSIVVLLPMMFTGNADFKETFAGQLAGGYVHVAALNSALTGQWLRVADPSLIGILLALAAAMIGATISRNYNMIAYALTANVIYIVVVGAFFVFGGILIEWVNGFMAFNIAFVPIVVLSEVAAEIKSIRMNDALAGVLSPKMLARISKAPEDFSLAPTEQTITVMFVDFVGFSKVAEQRSSREVFESLKKHFRELGSIVHKYHGIVDKSLGDGLLGVFGYDLVTREVSTSHADDALNCAVEIQRFMAHECASFKKSDADADAVIFAARVGLNTGVAFIGNIGEQGRLDLTVIGNTVNMGKRYEDACEAFKVLMGENTERYLSSKLKKLLVRRDLQIKHHKGLLHGYELDPFVGEEKLYKDAVTFFRNFSNIARSEERIIVPPGQSWELRQNGERVGTVVDYSSGGFCADLKNFYANKVALLFDLQVKSDIDGKVVKGIDGLNLVVRWGRKADSGFRHGLGLSDESAVRFNKLLAEELSSGKASTG